MSAPRCFSGWWHRLRHVADEAGVRSPVLICPASRSEACDSLFCVVLEAGRHSIRTHLFPLLPPPWELILRTTLEAKRLSSTGNTGGQGNMCASTVSPALWVTDHSLVSHKRNSTPTIDLRSTIDFSSEFTCCNGSLIFCAQEQMTF